MKIALVTEYFYPHSKGGTEKYVLELSKKLVIDNNEVDIITIAPKDIRSYNYEGINVQVISNEIDTDKDVISGLKPSNNLNNFYKTLIEGEYELIHFHSLTTAFSIHHIAVAISLNRIIYFTAHVPSVTCIHGDLMLYGKEPCDGEISNNRCMACYVSKKGFTPPFARIITSFVQGLSYPKSISTIVKQKQKNVESLNNLCDKIFIFTYWQKRIFIANGIDESKLFMIQQSEITENTSALITSGIKKLRKAKIAYAGRICYEKGVHILLETFINLNEPNLELHIAAIVENVDDPYIIKMQDISQPQSNVFWSYNLDQHEIQDFYSKVDYLCIPSIWYETGPYVLYEAFNYNLPVIANNLGDMEVWKDRGYSIELYNNSNELLLILKNITSPNQSE
ncbi:glycosyltransferase [Pedobacter sp. Leaf170]|uniref:glycosyltransferase n=1 Tax=Pedobacter sp. Leaf170 TaxID=2876558 RepID=UPI001E64FF97|nr:glycosyltransferase [Pedobacter sp. Leaf170]